MPTRIVLAILALASLASCQTAPVETDDCDHIASVCAPFQTGTGAAHDCYVLASDRSTPEATCEDRVQDCNAACASSDGGVDP